jgi:galacturan 1,4-alpha-galacturonidase
MANAQNGARIKAWAGPNVGSGIVKNVTFDGFVESSVDNPVVIDQCYMTNATECKAFPSNTLIQNIVFNKCVPFFIDLALLSRYARSIHGTSSGAEGAQVASLACSPDGRCSNVTVSNISLTCVALPPPFSPRMADARFSAPGQSTVKYACSNVQLSGSSASLFGTCTTT